MFFAYFLPLYSVPGVPDNLEKISWEKGTWRVTKRYKRLKTQPQNFFEKIFMQRCSARRVGPEKHQDGARNLKNMRVFIGNMHFLTVLLTKIVSF